MSLTQRQRTAIVAAASCLANFVNTCPEGHRPRDASCPFCADELAYDALLTAFPTLIQRERQPEGDRVSLSDMGREQAATKGPWVAGDHPSNDCRIEGPDGFIIYDEGGHTAADATFIAHARSDVPALLALVDSLMVERDLARDVAANLEAELAQQEQT